MICKGLEIRIHFVLMTIGTLEPGCISMGCPEKSWILFSLFFSKKKIEQIFSFFEQTENLYLYLMRMNRFQFNKFVFMTKKKRKEKKIIWKKSENFRNRPYRMVIQTISVRRLSVFFTVFFFPLIRDQKDGDDNSCNSNIHYYWIVWHFFGWQKSIFEWEGKKTLMPKCSEQNLKK